MASQGFFDCAPSLDVSVVLPWGGGPIAELNAQLDALRGQEFEGRGEVVVGWNIAWPPPPGLDEADGPRLSVSVVDASDVVGPGHARNVASRVARGAFILYCDGDDVVAPGWITAMLVQARHSDLFGGALDFVSLNEGRHGREDRRVAPSRKWRYLPFSPGANLGVRREWVERVGGWDPALRTGQDIDFCWRVQQEGGSYGFAADAVVHYRLRRGLGRTARQHVRYGYGDARLMRKHRPLGVRHSVVDSAVELARLVGATLLLVRHPGRRFLVAARWFHLAGRVWGSVRLRTWAV